MTQHDERKNACVMCVIACVTKRSRSPRRVCYLARRSGRGRAELDRVDGESQMRFGKVAVTQGHPRVFVSQKRLQAALLDSSHRVIARKGMSEIVKPEIFDAGALDGSLESAAHRVLVFERKQAAVESCW
jgi:hypothetical protein